MHKNISAKAIFKTFDPKDYLNQYYSKIGSENHGLLEFLVKAYQDIPKKAVMLEFSGGPTIYPLITAASKVKSIHFSDYLIENIKEVKRWKKNPSFGFNWKRFFKKALQLEGVKRIGDKEVIKRENMVRKKITKFLLCDAFKNDPIHPKYRNYYDVINTNFVTESITSSKKVWEKLVVNVCSLLKDNGVLIMTAIKGARYYHVGNKTFPAVSITEEDIVRILTKLGFNEASFILYSVPAEVESEELKGYTGYKGFIFIKAKR